MTAIIVSASLSILHRLIRASANFSIDLFRMDVAAALLVVILCLDKPRILIEPVSLLVLSWVTFFHRYYAVSYVLQTAAHATFFLNVCRFM